MKCDAKEKREEDERSTNARNDEKENSKSWQYLTCTGETMDEDDENECPWESGEDDENEKYEKNVDLKAYLNLIYQKISEFRQVI